MLNHARLLLRIGKKRGWNAVSPRGGGSKTSRHIVRCSEVSPEAEEEPLTGVSRRIMGAESGKLTGASASLAPQP